MRNPINVKTCRCRPYYYWDGSLGVDSGVKTLTGDAAG
jgi:hypothetical protein